jgi:hypothetical protein
MASTLKRPRLSDNAIDKIKKYGTAKFAAAIGVSPQFMWQILSKTAAFPPNRVDDAVAVDGCELTKEDLECKF